MKKLPPPAKKAIDLEGRLQSILYIFVIPAI
jgi:hypothetical protein